MNCFVQSWGRLTSCHLWQFVEPPLTVSPPLLYSKFGYKYHKSPGLCIFSPSDSWKCFCCFFGSFLAFFVVLSCYIFSVSFTSLSPQVGMCRVVCGAKFLALFSLMLVVTVPVIFCSDNSCGISLLIIVFLHTCLLPLFGFFFHLGFFLF